MREGFHIVKDCIFVSRLVAVVVVVEIPVKINQQKTVQNCRKSVRFYVPEKVFFYFWFSFGLLSRVFISQQLLLVEAGALFDLAITTSSQL